MKSIRVSIVLSAALFVLSSCTSTNVFMHGGSRADTSVEALDRIFIDNPEYQYHIRTDDKVNISVWQQDELSVGSVYGIYNSNEVYGKWLLVDADGNIEIPRFGTMHVRNMTTISLKDSLKTIFGEWLVNPIVDVKVMNKEITILGEVRNPQVVTIDTEQTRLLNIIAQANGFEFYADKKQVKVLRQVGEHVYIANIDLSADDFHTRRNIALYPGDVVLVPSRNSKRFDRQITNIIPFASTATAIAILLNSF
jgi:polysaccharide biosynthesis/export protein